MTRDNDRSAERRDAPAARPEGQERDDAPAPGRPEDIAALHARIADLERQLAEADSVVRFRGNDWVPEELRPARDATLARHKERTS